MKQLLINLILLYIVSFASSCSTVNSFGSDSSVQLPFIKNSANRLLLRRIYAVLTVWFRVNREVYAFAITLTKMQVTRILR